VGEGKVTVVTTDDKGNFENYEYDTVKEAEAFMKTLSTIGK